MTPKLSTRIATQSDANILANLYLASRKEYISFAPLVHSDAAIQQWMHDIYPFNLKVLDLSSENHH